MIQPSCGGIKPRITLLLASDHSRWCDGARGMVENTEFEIIGEAPCCSQALGAALQTHPYIVLLDVGITGGDGMEQLCALKEADPRMAVVLLYVTAAPILMVRAIDAGAAGCLLMGIAYEALLDALRAVACGARVVMLSC